MSASTSTGIESIPTRTALMTLASIRFSASQIHEILATEAQRITKNRINSETTASNVCHSRGSGNPGNPRKPPGFRVKPGMTAMPSLFDS